MADPFRPNPKSQLLREAQIGLSIVAILLVLLVYVAFYRITGRGRHIPDHVRNAPVAQLVWPGAAPEQGVVVREIEMTPQEFRDTRVPPTAAAIVKDSVSPTVLPTAKSRDADSARQSTYLVPPSPDAMAKTMTSRPNTSLDNPNFSPSKPFQPTVASDSSFPPMPEVSVAVPTEKVAIKNVEPAKALPILGQANEFGSEASDAPVVSDSVQVVAVDKGDSDPKIELAVLESEGNDFKIDFPSEAESASTKLDQPVGLNAKEYQPKPIRSEPLKSEVFETGNEFNPIGFTPKPSRDVKPLEEFASEMPAKLASKKPPLVPLNSALELADQGFKPRLSGSPDAPKVLTDPFLDPVLAPSRPLVDQSSDKVSVKRLPRSSTANPESLDELSKTAALISTAPEPSNSTESSSQTEPRNPLEYVAQPGDSFWSISQSVYNDGRYFRALYKYNQPQVPEFDSLETGTKIATPSQADLFKLWPDLCPAQESSEARHALSDVGSSNGRIYTTRSGDTLFDIARQRLGQASRYAEILNLNEIRLGQEVTHLTPLTEGVRLVMPAQ